MRSVLTVPTLTAALLLSVSTFAQDVDPRFAPVGEGESITGPANWWVEPDVKSFYTEGMKLWTGDGVPQDDAKAVERFEQADRWNHPQATFMLGLAAAEGRGMTQDDVKAREKFYRAARLGNDEAQYRYGVMTMTGQGGPKEPEYGLVWIAKAANAGFADAQTVYAQALADGTGTARDRGHALMWALLAEQGGQTQAAALRATLEKDLDAATRTKATEAAQGWKPTQWYSFGDEPMVRFVQESLNTLHDAGLTVDGQWGPATVQAMEAYKQYRRKVLKRGSIFPASMHNISIKYLRDDLKLANK